MHTRPTDNDPRDDDNDVKRTVEFLYYDAKFNDLINDVIKHYNSPRSDDYDYSGGC